MWFFIMFGLETTANVISVCHKTIQESRVQPLAAPLQLQVGKKLFSLSSSIF